MIIKGEWNKQTLQFWKKCRWQVNERVWQLGIRKVEQLGFISYTHMITTAAEMAKSRANYPSNVQKKKQPKSLPDSLLLFSSPCTEMNKRWYCLHLPKTPSNRIVLTSGIAVTAGCYRIYIRFTPAFGQVLGYSQGGLGQHREVYWGLMLCGVV